MRRRAKHGVEPRMVEVVIVSFSCQLDTDLTVNWEEGAQRLSLASVRYF